VLASTCADQHRQPGDPAHPRHRLRWRYDRPYTIRGVPQQLLRRLSSRSAATRLPRPPGDVHRGGHRLRAGVPPTRPRSRTAARTVPSLKEEVAVGAGAATTADSRSTGRARARHRRHRQHGRGDRRRSHGACRPTSTRWQAYSTANSKPFPNTAIVTFKDDVTIRKVSPQGRELKTVVNGLFASGGGDCPESSNAALVAPAGCCQDGRASWRPTPTAARTAIVGHRRRALPLQGRRALDDPSRGMLRMPASSAARAAERQRRQARRSST